jgi:photosystem II stability/assembly factor-like uncharacterized protein
MAHKPTEILRKICAILSGLWLVTMGAAAPETWTPCGWGGGGFYYAAAFHPTREGVIYMGGDVNGMYKSEDHGKNWRIINNGLANYGVFSLAVDRVNPETVYAATESGLCKSKDGGENWLLLPQTGPKDLRLTGEKEKSIRCVAVDPTDGKVVYAASPAGKVCKSTDGGQTWKAVYEKKADGEEPDMLRVQYGKVSQDWHGGIWMPLAFPKGVTSADCVGFGFAFKGDGKPPRDAFLTLKTSGGATYRSRNIRDLFADTKRRNVVFKATDFSLDPDQAKTLPATPDWATVNRMDLACVGPLMNDMSVARVGRVYFALKRTPDGKTATVETPNLWTVRDFTKDKTVAAYSNVRAGGSAASGTIYSVTVAAGKPSLVLAATETSGLVISTDAGGTWRETATPKKASSAAIAETDAKVIYASFFSDGIWKSTDQGMTWSKCSQGLPEKVSILEVAVSPANPLDVYAIGTVGWNGSFFHSNDGGKTWSESSQVGMDETVNPTLPEEASAAKTTRLSHPTNVAISPVNPKELFLSANWRPCLSDDGGRTWAERVRGADITCATDIRFHGGKVYVSAMDEGTLVSADNGGSWRQLWPRKWSDQWSGHNWRLGITGQPGAEHIIATVSSWNAAYPNGVIVSEDGGKTYQGSTAGLPDYIPAANTMWGRSYSRALAVDPQNPKIVYLGMDGDPEGGKSGGGIFKSEDGGRIWKQMSSQPASRRMFFGLAVDPTNSQRLYWGACGANGGVHRSEDGGATWQSVFTGEGWVFNLHVTADGTVYCPGKNLWRSTDHGKTWTQITKRNGDQVIVGLETDPRDPKTIWYSSTTWGNEAEGGVFRTRDGGATWQEITGNLPYRKPMLLRFNPATNELWAGGVGLYKLKQTAGQ